MPWIFVDRRGLHSFPFWPLEKKKENCFGLWSRPTLASTCVYALSLMLSMISGSASALARHGIATRRHCLLSYPTSLVSRYRILSPSRSYVSVIFLSFESFAINWCNQQRDLGRQRRDNNSSKKYKEYFQSFSSASSPWSRLMALFAMLWGMTMSK